MRMDLLTELNVTQVTTDSWYCHVRLLVSHSILCCRLRVLVGFEICIILSAICSVSYVPCSSCQEFSVLYVHLIVGKILVTF